MAITKVGILVSSDETFGDDNDLDFYSEAEEDCKLGSVTFSVTGLTPETIYEVLPYFVQDDKTITGSQTEKFETTAE